MRSWEQRAAVLDKWGALLLVTDAMSYLLFRPVLLIVALLCATPLSLLGEEVLFLEVPRARIERIIELGYNLDPSLEEELSKLHEAYPQSPVPGMLEAGRLYWMQNYKEWDEESQQRFEEQADRALEKAEAYLKNHRDEVDARFAVAMVELMQVIYYVDHSRWWAAFWKSRGSLKTMRKILDEYPQYHDAKLPLGMANCYLSRTPGYLKPLAFLMRFQGDWELGLRYLEETREQGFFLKADAGYYLAGAKMELADDREGARTDLRLLASEYPGNLKFRAMWAELERSVGHHETARDLAMAVLASESISDFPAIEGRTLSTLIWSSLGAGDFELALASSDRAEALAGSFPRLAPDVEWAKHARAEALLALGRREEAFVVWRTISAKVNPNAAQVAERRMRDLEAAQ